MWSLFKLSELHLCEAEECGAGNSVVFWYRRAVYLTVCGVLMTSPGVEAVTKLVLTSLAGLFLALPPVIGIWRICGEYLSPVTQL
jgi:hypothetical protein